MNTQTKTDFVIEPKKSLFRIVFPIVILLTAIAAILILVTSFKVITVSNKG